MPDRAERSEPREFLLPHILVPPPGPQSRALARRAAAVECPAWDARRDAREVASATDQGAIYYAGGVADAVECVDGNRYVDLTCGFGALALGHRPKAPAAAARAQEERLALALGDVYSAEVKVALLESLAAIFPEPGAKGILGLSGADAVTAALKTAVLATGKSGVIAFEGAYHGLSYAPLAACGLAPAFREPFGDQLGRHVRFAPYPSSNAELATSLQRVRRELSQGTVGAILVEPIAGRGGCIVPPSEFLPELRALADRSGALLIVDEIWTGLGRSGAWLAATPVVPDVVVLGKALGAGYPISACVGRSRVMDAWGPKGGGVIHTATHFGAPPACAAALATLQTLRADSLPERAARVGSALRGCLVEATRDHGVKDVRGPGLMVGVELEGGAGRALAVARRLLARGYIVLTGGARGDVLTLTPALTIDERLLPGFVEALAASLGEIRVP